MVLVSVVILVTGGSWVSVTDSVPEDRVTVSEPEGVGTESDSVTETETDSVSVGIMFVGMMSEGSRSVGTRSVGSGRSEGPGRSGTWESQIGCFPDLEG